MSTEVLKALANPIRRRVWAEIARLHYARAADLAQLLDVPANTLSFHLRVLAKAGLIHEAPEQARDRRDRVWTTTKGGLTLGTPDAPVADVALGNAVLTGYVAETQHLMERVSAWAMEFATGRDTQVKGAMTNYTLRLSRERFVELADRIDSVLEEFRDRDEDGHTWQLSIIAASDEI